MIVLLIYSCTPEKPQVTAPANNTSVSNKETYKRTKNPHWKECRHKETVKIMLEMELEQYLSVSKLPKKSLSQWFIDQHNPEYCNPRITKELDELLVTVTSDLVRKHSINYDAIEIDSLTLIKTEN